MINRNNPSNFTKKKLLFLAFPIFFSNFAIPFVGIVDTGLMGNLGQAKYLAATSIATSVMTMIIWSCGFLRMGTVGIVSQLYGKSDYREILKTLLRNIFIAILLSIIIILIKPLIISLIDNFFATSKETIDLVNVYVSVRVFSAPAELTIYILIGFYLGIQKTNISSLLIIVLSFLNIFFSSFLVLSINLKILGVVLGTLIASYITMIIFCIYTYYFIVKKFQINFNFQRLFVPTKIFKLLTINFDIFIRTIFLTFSFFWISYLGAKLGEDYLAVNAILLQFILLSAFFLDAYAFATEGAIGFTIGRKNKKSFLLVVKNSIQLSFITALVISIMFLIFYKQTINILTNVDFLRYIAYKHIIWVILIPPIASFCYQLDGIFIGASQTTEIRNAMIFSVIMFVIISIYSTQYFKNHGLWFSLMTLMILRSVTLNHFFGKILRRF